MKILIVEDDRTLANNLARNLQKNRFAVDIVNTNQDAQIATDVNDYDCIVLDLGLPDGDGFSLLKAIRKEKDKTPVIIVTARGQIDDRIEGLNLGADDYVPKPVDTNELIARIRAVIRRNNQSVLPVITIGDLTIKPAQHTASVNNQTLELTAKEFSVLEYLSQHQGQAITRTMLMEHLWGSDFDSFSNVVDVYIHNLRKELNKYSKKTLIKTIRGKGYIIDEY